MNSFDEGLRIGEIVGIRSKLRSNNKANREVREAIRGALSANGIECSGVMHQVIIAVEDELNNSLNEVILPGGTNCKAV